MRADCAPVRNIELAGAEPADNECGALVIAHDIKWETLQDQLANAQELDNLENLLESRFRDLLRQSHPGVQISEKMAREIKERHGFVHDVNERAEVTLPIDGRPYAPRVGGGRRM